MNAGLIFLVSFVLWGLAIIGYDFYVVFTQGRKQTISYKMFCWGRASPLFAFACGLVIGLTVGGLSVHFWLLAVQP